MTNGLQILKSDLLSVYLEQVPQGLREAFEALNDAELSTDTFSFYISVASVFSSKIEGEEIELDSFIKHKRFGIEFLADYTKKIDDLYKAYTFAKGNQLNKSNIEEVHRLLSKNIINKNQQGRLRVRNIYVTTTDGRIEYVAALPHELAEKMKKLYSDIDSLLNEELNIEECLFYASFIHLVFVKLHPWINGNGRSGRLIEKWFLAQKTGRKSLVFTK